MFFTFRLVVEKEVGDQMVLEVDKKPGEKTALVYLKSLKG